jgi:hypothetical protein
LQKTLNFKMTTVDNHDGQRWRHHVRIPSDRVEARGPLTGGAGHELGCSEEAEQDETRQRFMED